MPQHRETRILPFRPEQMFDLVADIQRYPEFLPWCKAARIVKTSETQVVADLIIGYKLFTERFRSEVALRRPQIIEVTYLSGPLSYLSNQWEFRPSGKDSCAISFHVDFDFRHPLLRSAMQLFFDKALMKMVTAFEKRATALYAKHKQEK